MNKEQIKKIALLQLEDLKKMLKKQDIKIDVNENALNLLSDLGYDPMYGARPLKRVIQQELINEISKNILSGDYIAEDTILVDAKDGNFVFDVKKGKVVKEK